jgi:hypothetical protein
LHTLARAGLGNAVAGVPALAAVQARDRFQNECIVGGDKITANISGASGTHKCDVKDFGNGKYRVKVSARVVCAHGVSYRWCLCAVHWSAQGRHVQAVDSACRPRCQGLAVHCHSRAVAWQVCVCVCVCVRCEKEVDAVVCARSAGHSSAHGDGLKKVVAGETGHFTVDVHDEFGNRVPTGGHKVLALATGTRALKPAVVDNHNGSYSASYTPTVAGDYKIVVTIDGDAVSGSPFAVHVRALWVCAVSAGMICVA